MPVRTSRASTTEANLALMAVPCLVPSDWRTRAWATGAWRLTSTYRPMVRRPGHLRAPADGLAGEEAPRVGEPHGNASRSGGGDRLGQPVVQVVGEPVEPGRLLRADPGDALAVGLQRPGVAREHDRGVGRALVDRLQDRGDGILDLGPHQLRLGVPQRRAVPRELRVLAELQAGPVDALLDDRPEPGIVAADRQRHQRGALVEVAPFALGQLTVEALPAAAERVGHGGGQQVLGLRAGAGDQVVVRAGVPGIGPIPAPHAAARTDTPATAPVARGRASGWWGSAPCRSGLGVVVASAE